MIIYLFNFQLENEKKLLEEDKPKDDNAKPIEKEPDIENDKVKETLRKLGDYKYNPVLDKKYLNCRVLGPYVFLYNPYSKKVIR